MRRLERPVSFTLEPSAAEQLTGVGGRFKVGLRASVRGDRVIAWLPTSARESPPKFAGQMERGPVQTNIVGTIRESPWERLQPLFWAALAVVMLLIAVLSSSGRIMTSGDALAPLLIGAFGTVAFAGLSLVNAVTRRATFVENAGLLETGMRDWLESRA